MVDLAHLVLAQSGITQLTLVRWYELVMSLAADEGVDGFLLQCLISAVLTAASVDLHMFDSLRHLWLEFGVFFLPQMLCKGFL